MENIQLNKQEDKFKYELVYLNGGFNGESIEIKPSEDGKLIIKIPIYGGGLKKTLTVSSPNKISSLVTGVSMADRQNDSDSAADVNEKLEKYFTELKNVMSLKFVELFKEVDDRAKKIIKESFKEV